ncbi:histidinol-phosphate transaminase [Pelagibius sp.]|uniref:histidinol-phosphate transaminase n=1 Tax=Pelagibius sp. TaxID=1931238 RepID=UPI003BB10B84
MSQPSPLKPQPRPGILDVAPYVGGESKAEGANRVIRLASNENPLGPSAKAIAAYEAEKGNLHRYPDGGALALRRALAEAEGLDAERIVCGAGSDELIALLVRAYAGPGDEVLYSEHGFLMYGISARTAGATAVSAPEVALTADVDGLLSRVTDKTRLLFLANPNNPTGSYISEAALRRLHAGLPSSVLLVIDAAYAEYVTAADYPRPAALVEEAGNVVMLRTFSKIYGLAALRLGWAYAPAAVVDVLNRVRGPFNVSQAAQAAGLAAIADKDHVAQSVAHNAKWRSWFSEVAAKAGVEPLPSAGNFILLRFPGGQAEAEGVLADLKARGILVRGVGAYGLANCLRVTIGTEDEMRATAEALQAVLG